MSSKWISVPLTLFSLAYLASALPWVLPLRKTPSLLNYRERVSRPFLKNLSLYQNWAMFAPDPLTIDRSMEALVSWSDGTQTRYLMPADRTGWVVERIRGEQLRKWSLDHLRLDANRAFWPSAARYYARVAESAVRVDPKVGTDPGFYPPLSLPQVTQVELIRHWTPEIRPGQRLYSQPIPLHWDESGELRPPHRFTPGMGPNWGGTPRPVRPGPKWHSFTFHTERIGFPAAETPSP